MEQNKTTSNPITWQDKVEKFAKEHGSVMGNKTGCLTYIPGKRIVNFKKKES